MLTLVYKTLLFLLISYCLLTAGSLIYLYADQDAQILPWLVKKSPQKPLCTGPRYLVTAGSEYAAGPLRAMFFGTGYRREWMTPVKVPILNMDTTAGGLTPRGTGGGIQTMKLELISKDGHEFSARSVNKKARGILPGFLRKTFIGDAVQDQVSSAHPYGALVIPPLAEAVGIYYTSPRLVVLPDSAGLGEYRKAFGCMPVMFEIHPDDNLAPFSRFGNAYDADKSETMFRKMAADPSVRLDTIMFLKARLFDMVIGDWDRHPGQWRWAEFTSTQGNLIYRPIPEDRDQVFFKFDGIIPWIASNLAGLEGPTHFGPKINRLQSLNYNARYLDERFLTGIEPAKWLEIAQIIQWRLTDAVIDSAVRQIPKEVYPFSGKDIRANLKSRRNDLYRAAEAYYRLLNKDLTIYLQDYQEEIRLEMLADGSLAMEIRGNSSRPEYSGWMPTFSRRIDPAVTRRITFRGRSPEDKLIIPPAGLPVEVRFIYD